MSGIPAFLASFNGTVGLEACKIQAFTDPWSADSVLILHSDGLGARWNLQDYPGLAARHPALVSGVVFRDHSRIQDDSTVVVVRETRTSW